MNEDERPGNTSDPDRLADATTTRGATPWPTSTSYVAAPGTRLLERYCIEQEIGRGGMGVVYRARDEKLERTVAIKILPSPAIDARARERFLREARAAAALNHANIVAVHDAGEADGCPFLVMEHVAGRGLDEQPPSSIDEALVVARQIVDALEHAHERGLIHRDLKPGNVLVSRDGDRLTAKLTDMGIALARGAARVTLSGAIAGTPAYMAPEQALGRSLDGRADLYALGVMLYQWVARRLPFDGDDALAVVSQHIHAPVVPPRTFCSDLPSGLEPLILRLLSKAPEDRFASAAEVRAALEVVGTTDTVTAPPREVRIEGLTRGRMVGRRSELVRLQELWRAAAAGTSSLALVSGEPGVGKTRLAFEVMATAQLDGALVLTGGCYENEATTPYLPFVEAFRRVVREWSDDRLRDALGDTASEMTRLAPEIESRVGPFAARPKLSSQEERLRLFDHVARFLRRLAAPRGLLMFVDDLQWADHGSLALLRYLLRQLASDRVLFLGTYREIELDRAHPLSKSLVDWNRERLATRVRLDRLTQDDTALMVATLLGQVDVSRGFVASLYEETEGNPFFVEEIVKALIAEGGLVHDRTGWQRCGTGEFVLPQSVKAAIGSRLERVSEICNDVLRTAAVLGKLFDFGELASVAARPEDELLDALDEAVSAQLIVAGGGDSFRFTHDKIREVLYDELNPIRRRRLHARIAAGLERLTDQGATVAVEDLAHHYVESGDYEKGLLYSGRAADSALRVFAYDEALAVLGRARECAEALDRGDEVARIDVAMGNAAHARGDLSAAAEYFERALDETASADERNALRSKLGDVYVTTGDPKGLEHVQRAIDELDATRLPSETARALMIQARYHHLAGRLEQAAEIYARSVELAEPAGDADLLVRVYSYFAGTFQHLARFDESDAMARRAVETGQRDGLPLGVMFGYEFLCENHFFRGRWRESIDYGEREEKLAREMHAGERYGWAHIRAFALLGTGRLDEAEQVARRAIDESVRSGERRLELWVRLALAGCRSMTGSDDEAEQIASGVVRDADDAEWISHRILARAYWIRSLLRRGSVEHAVDEARLAVDLWRSSGSDGAGLMEGATFAEALLRGGAADEALRVLDEHDAVATRTASRQRLGENLRVRGLLAVEEGRTDAARAAFDQAVVAFESTESPLYLARMLGERAVLHRAAGRLAVAEADIVRARELLDGCGATIEVLPSGCEM